MSLIQLPSGMSPDEYWSTPEGRRTADQQRRFQEEMVAKQKTHRSPGQQAVTPRPGQAQPQPDPYSSSTRQKGTDDIAREIETALGEMAPDMSDSERRLMAADLAREYRQQRSDVVRGMTRQAPAAAPEQGRGRKWDGNKYEYTDTPEYEARAAARQAAQQSQAQEQQRRREQYQRSMAQATKEMALNSERAKNRGTGRRGPLQQQEVQDRAQRQAAGQAFNAYVSGQSTVQPPGMAQSIQPQGSGSAYGSPDQQGMYWQLIDGGMDPAQASTHVSRAFRYAPR